MWVGLRHWLPSMLVDPDPMYTSIVVANLGSVGLDAAFHHLYEWGTATYFAVIGRIHDRPIAVDGKVEIRKIVEIKYTFDERVEDGLAVAIALRGVQELLENPEKWETGCTDLGGRPPVKVSV
jgi:pyruvate/2-oxoglutarate dehydrogenase complex dihydrolipoamide acyltransferase (E2) component